MPANTTEIGVGASTWASGSQVWTGTMGSFTANPINKNQNARVLKFIPANEAVVSGCKSVPGTKFSGLIKYSNRNVCVSFSGAISPLASSCWTDLIISGVADP